MPAVQFSVLQPSNTQLYNVIFIHGTCNQLACTALYFGDHIKLTHTLWSAVAQRKNAGLTTERARVRIPLAIVAKFGHFRSLHDAPVHSAV